MPKTYMVDLPVSEMIILSTFYCYETAVPQGMLQFFTPKSTDLQHGPSNPDIMSAQYRLTLDPGTKSLVL